MPWKPGQSGNVDGRPLGARTVPRPFLSALERAIAQDDGKRLRKCAETLLDKAAEGEPWAVSMLAERLDGKATQEVVVKRAPAEMSLDDILTELAQMAAATGGGGAETGADEPSQLH